MTDALIIIAILALGLAGSLVMNFSQAQAVKPLRRANAELERLHAGVVAANKQLHEELNAETAHSEHLRIQLQSASKNDNRDPTTGRFVKAG